VFAVRLLTVAISSVKLIILFSAVNLYLKVESQYKRSIMQVKLRRRIARVSYEFWLGFNKVEQAKRI
jgi:hypothetical protein